MSPDEGGRTGGPGESRPPPSAPSRNQRGRASARRRRGAGAGGPRLQRPRPREGGAGRPCPARTHGSAAESAQFPSLLFLPPSLSLSPPLTSPSAIPSFLRTPPPGIPFFCCFGASFWLARRGAASAGRGGGLGPQPAAHRPDTAGPSGGLTASRPGAPSAHRSALSKLLSSVCARQGWGSVRPARRAGDRRGYLWTGSLDSDQGQLQAQKLLSS